MKKHPVEAYHEAWDNPKLTRLKAFGFILIWPLLILIIPALDTWKSFRGAEAAKDSFMDGLEIIKELFGITFLPWEATDG